MRHGEALSASGELQGVLGTREPRLLKIPSGFPMPPDPIAWAHRVCSAHPADLRVQAMPRTVGAAVEDQNRALFLAPGTEAEVIQNMLTGISRGAAAHVAMELWHSISFGERVADASAVPFKHYFEKIFEQRLRELNPVGHHSKLTLWFSADQHLYDAHCDVADGLLFQLVGNKAVEVWPAPDERLTQPLFDHAYRFNPITARGEQFKVTAGEVLFIPAGAMHEVVVAPDQVSVSMSLHMGAPFPLMELCRDLNHMSDRGEVFSLPEAMSRRGKFHVFYFEPAMFAGDDSRAAMPGALREALLDVVTRPKACSRERLGELLDSWWQRALARPCYPGPDLPPEEPG